MYQSQQKKCKTIKTNVIYEMTEVVNSK